MRICIVYDCLYPHTVGGAERWYRNVALRLAADAHDVTYLTMRQWDTEDEPEVPGVHVIAVAPQMPLYAGGRRRILPPLVFGLGVLRHLIRHGRRYDVVHTASFPYFSLLAAAAVRRVAGYRLVVDWHELWTGDYWREYLGPFGGRIGWQVQRLCLRVPQRAFCFSRLVERRLLADGVRGEVTVLEGQFEGTAAETPLPAEPLVVFAGRHIPEKNPVAVVHAIAKARETIPELRGVVYGDGPERPKVLAGIDDHGLHGIVEALGFLDADAIEDVFGRALCIVLLRGGGLRARRARSAFLRNTGDRGRRCGQRCRGIHRRRRERFVVDDGLTQLTVRSSSSTARRCASERPRSSGSPTTPNDSLSARPSICSKRPTSMADQEPSVLHVLPYPGGGGETYVNQLARMDGYRFERMFVAPGPTHSPAVLAGGIRAQPRPAAARICCTSRARSQPCRPPGNFGPPLRPTINH